MNDRASGRCSCHCTVVQYPAEPGRLHVTSCRIAHRSSRKLNAALLCLAPPAQVLFYIASCVYAVYTYYYIVKVYLEAYRIVPRGICKILVKIMVRTCTSHCRGTASYRPALAIAFFCNEPWASLERFAWPCAFSLPRISRHRSNLVPILIPKPSAGHHFLLFLEHLPHPVPAGS